MEFSQELDKLGPAALAVSKQSHGVEKNQQNFKFGGYADLKACIQAYRPLLNEHGLFITQGFGSNEKGDLLVQTALIHAESGQYIKTETPMSPSSAAITRDSCQAYGSAYSYGRRYAYMAIMSAFPTNESTDAARDDDGNAADNIIEDNKKKPGAASGLSEPKGKQVTATKTTKKRRAKKATKKSDDVFTDDWGNVDVAPSKPKDIPEPPLG
tara:strand:- start:1 stop:636 length:636 start_codon:yes stop_codon:yes gene_type:complete